MEFSKTNEIIYTFLWGVRGEWDISSSILAVDLHLFKGIQRFREEVTFYENI